MVVVQSIAFSSNPMPRADVGHFLENAKSVTVVG